MNFPVEDGASDDEFAQHAFDKSCRGEQLTPKESEAVRLKFGVWIEPTLPDVEVVADEGLRTSASQVLHPDSGVSSVEHTQNWKQKLQEFSSRFELGQELMAYLDQLGFVTHCSIQGEPKRAVFALPNCHGSVPWFKELKDEACIARYVQTQKSLRQFDEQCILRYGPEKIYLLHENTPHIQGCIDQAHADFCKSIYHYAQSQGFQDIERSAESRNHFLSIMSNQASQGASVDVLSHLSAASYSKGFCVQNGFQNMLFHNTSPQIQQQLHSLYPLPSIPETDNQILELTQQHVDYVNKSCASAMENLPDGTVGIIHMGTNHFSSPDTDVILSPERMPKKVCMEAALANIQDALVLCVQSHNLHNEVTQLKALCKAKGIKITV